MAEAADFLITTRARPGHWQRTWHGLELVDRDEHLVIRIPDTLQRPGERAVEVLLQHFQGQRRIADLSHTYYHANRQQDHQSAHIINMVGLIPYAYRST